MKCYSRNQRELLTGSAKTLVLLDIRAQYFSEYLERHWVKRHVCNLKEIVFIMVALYCLGTEFELFLVPSF